MDKTSQAKTYWQGGLRAMAAGWLSQGSYSFAVRTALAGALALFLATACHLQHPWWAAMTVWLVAQPSRGLLRDRVLARVIGTVIGALAGAMLLLGFKEQVGLVLVSLGIWMAACASIGNLLRHFRSYVFLLAGYTAAIVVLSGLYLHQANSELAWHRVWATLIGVICSTVVSLPFLTRTRADDILTRPQMLVAGMLTLCERHLHNPSAVAVRDECEELMRQVAVLEPELDQLASGSYAGWMRAHYARAILRQVIEALSALVIQFDCAASSGSSPLRPGADDASIPAHLRCERLADIAQQVGQTLLAASLTRMSQLLRSGRTSRTLQLTLAFNDWRATGRAAARPLLALTLTSLLWQTTHWEEGPLMVMTATLFASLFSSHPRGSLALRDVLIGTGCGAFLGVGYRIGMATAPASLLLSILALLPVLITGAWLMSRVSTSKLAIDLIMSFLLIAQPPAPLPISLQAILSQVVAMLVGVLITLAVYRFMLPANDDVLMRQLKRRRQRLLWRLVHASPSMRLLILKVIGNNCLQEIVLQRGASEAVQSSLAFLAAASILASDAESGSRPVPVRKPSRTPYCGRHR
jgi:p-hydroxybenzoic acid efflux pump subunit AaeB